jgi:hypothetical protein
MTIQLSKGVLKYVMEVNLMTNNLRRLKFNFGKDESCRRPSAYFSSAANYGRASYADRLLPRN